MKFIVRATLALAFVLLINVNVVSVASAAPVVIPLDESLAAKSLADLASQTDCSLIPGGAVADTDGWVFTQPLAQPVGVVYSIGFIILSDPPSVVVFLVDATGISSVPLESGDQALAATTSALTRKSLAALPLPEGVSGSLIDDGAGGVWLRTPAGWLIAAGALGAISETTDVTMFGLRSACPPLQAQPSPSPSASPSPSPSISPSPSATLPKTGAAVSTTGIAGAVLVLLGTGLLLIRKHRRRES